MSNKSYGLGKEREVKAMCYEDGALFVQRARGSFGHYDVLAFFPNYCKLISVKATKQRYFAKGVEIRKLKSKKLPKYCIGELWVWYSPNKDRKEKGWVKMMVK